MTAADAFDAARRRYNAARGILPDDPACGSRMVVADSGFRCEDPPNHDGRHRAFVGTMIVYWD